MHEAALVWSRMGGVFLVGRDGDTVFPGRMVCGGQVGRSVGGAYFAAGGLVVGVRLGGSHGSGWAAVAWRWRLGFSGGGQS